MKLAHKRGKHMEKVFITHRVHKIIFSEILRSKIDLFFFVVLTTPSQNDPKIVEISLYKLEKIEFTAHIFTVNVFDDDSHVRRNRLSRKAFPEIFSRYFEFCDLKVRGSSTLSTTLAKYELHGKRLSSTF